MNNKARIFIAEMIGTGILVLGGCGSAVIAGDKIGFLGISLAFGLSLLVMAYTIGGISGCHVNPAVSIGLVVAKKLDKPLLPIYIGAQVLGAILGALILYLIVSGNADFNMSKSVFATNGWGSAIGNNYSWVSAAITEIVLTSFLLFTIMGTTHPRFPTGFAGLSIGLMLALIHLVGIPVTNTSVNPARSIGVAVFKGVSAFEQLPLFIIAPIIGGILGVLAYNLIHVDQKL